VRRAAEINTTFFHENPMTHLPQKLHSLLEMMKEMIRGRDKKNILSSDQEKK
jgi:hypothetical protein